MKLFLFILAIIITGSVQAQSSYTGLFYAPSAEGVHTDAYFNLRPNSGATTLNNWNVYHEDGNSIFSIGFGAAQPYVHVGANKTTNLFVNGNVGIGTISPVLKLHVITSNNLDGLGLQHSNGAWANIFSPSMTGGAYNGITQPGDAGVIFGNNIGVNSVSNGFVIAPHRSTTSGLRINNNGDVGIGIANPGSFKLAVAGKIWTQEIQVALNIPGPDYVFEKEYKLLSLEQVQSYINQNKHLPEVPSAKEMEANGVNLGEMNMLLLKKVEELTLYVIELKKENRSEKDGNEQLRSTLNLLIKEVATIKYQNK